MSTSGLKGKWYGTTFIHVPGLLLSKRSIFFCKQKKRSQGKIFLTLFFSPSAVRFLFVQIRLVWWKDLTECVLVLCKPGFCVVEHVGSWHFWIWERSLRIWNGAWTSAEIVVWTTIATAAALGMAVVATIESVTARTHRKARNTFWLHAQWLPLCSSLLEQMAC